MKTTITLLLITVTTFSGVEPTKQEPQKPTAAVERVIATPMEKRTDSLKNVYFKEISIRDSSTDELIDEVVKLKAEIKHLKKINSFLRQNIDTVFIRDTVFKKRKFYQLFKK